MAVGFPAKTTYADGDVFSASDINDTNGTLNLAAGAQWAAGKNRIINGAMTIDQRNAGAAVTVNANSAFFPVDRFQGIGQASDGVFTLQQLTSTPPAGLVNYIRATVTTADASIGASERYFFQQKIEGNQLYNFGLGTANAKTFTLSFYVRSSLTGTFSGAMRNNSANRSYVFSYSINAANTWERKSITLAGDTTGTWETGVNTGMNLNWSLGAGSTLSTTANAWTAGNFIAETGAVNLIGTLSATWDITGVQLELGSVATEFSLTTGTIQGELAACQRYYWNAKTADNTIGAGVVSSTTNAFISVKYPQTMRIVPTLTFATAATLEQSGSAAVTAASIAVAGTDGAGLSCTSSGLTNGRGAILYVTTGSFQFSSEL
jgi:hypothetical protein